MKSPGILELLYSSNTEMKAQSNCLMQLSVWDSTEEKRRSLRYHTLSGLISNLPSSMQLWTIDVFIICRICNICTICLIYIICREYVKYAEYAKYASNSKYVKYDKYIEICKILTFDYPAQSLSHHSLDECNNDPKVNSMHSMTCRGWFAFENITLLEICIICQICITCQICIIC